MIRLENVSFGYGGAHTIKDVSFVIEKGEFVALLGANGAGKSTTAKLIRGLLKPTGGKVFIDGTDISRVKASSLAGKIGFLFQNPDRQICKNTVSEELRFSLECCMPDKSKYDALIEATIESFGFDPDGQLFSMSRGERQRVALASVLIGRPDVLILDEPTTGLDYRECIHIMDMVKALNDDGITVVMVTHDMEIALDYSARVLVMSAGSLLADGNPKDIFYEADTLEKSSLLPPQIVGLSSALGKPFGRVYTVDEMAAAIAKQAGGEVGS